MALNKLNKIASVYKEAEKKKPAPSKEPIEDEEMEDCEDESEMPVDKKKKRKK